VTTAGLLDVAARRQIDLALSIRVSEKLKNAL